MTTSHVNRCAGLVMAWVLGSTSVWAQGTDELARGEVRKIDEAAAKITIKHGDIPSLDMPPMTMVFTVRDKALLQRARPGDKIRFDVIQQDGKLIVTRIETDQ
ncbi:copper-binding protein [Rhodoferax sp. OV413]|uniref:copper-binding protein n=1 Tax=Rhodoferax sp. OV413 TaxID=1855285 RepID=UPI0025EAFC10|nr:copper-binding protein [Rhodoferax sp. OV413]